MTKNIEISIILFVLFETWFNKGWLRLCIAIQKRKRHIFTKALPEDKFYNIRDVLGIPPNDHYRSEMWG